MKHVLVSFCSSTCFDPSEFGWWRCVWLCLKSFGVSRRCLVLVLGLISVFFCVLMTLVCCSGMKAICRWNCVSRVCKTMITGR